MTNLTLKRRTKTVLLGLGVHIVLFIAAADVYFSSPIDHGMSSVKSTDDPPAKRIVFIVADGLRAQAVYGENINNIPYLSYVRRNRGSWGIAYTRVPTETRPGHVAMLAGIYEDPSAVFKGWKANPVEFDHVIQQSKNAWCWGSPDIVYLFTKDTESMKHVHVYAYGSEMEDFGKSNTTVLDAWVFQRVKKFLNQYHNEPHINDTGNFFFLHLLGIDTAGHGFKPASREYIDNIKMVDRNVQEIETLFQKTFPDNKTVYIFTSDHGMTDWGSHGAGTDEETNVPFIIWGAGIKQHPFPHDINQIDITPLMASLIGINIPVNSLGILPAEFLNIPRNKVVKLLKSNINQLMEMFEVKMKKVQASVLSKSFEILTYEYFIDKIKELDNIDLTNNYHLFIEQSRDIMNLLLYGIDYYHNYFKNSILWAVSTGFIAWLVYLGAMTLSDRDVIEARIKPLKHKFIIYVVLALFIVEVVIIYLVSLPLMYYLYFSFPIIMLYIVGRESQRVLALYYNLRPSLSTLIKGILIGCFTIELFVWGFKEPIWFCLAIPLQSLWMYFSPSFVNMLQAEGYNNDIKFWLGFNFLLAVFPAAPKVLTYFPNFWLIFGSAAWLIFNYGLVRKIRTRYDAPQYQGWSLTVQWIIFFLSTLWAALIHYGPVASDSSFKLVSWFFSLIPILLIPYTSTYTILRYTAIILGFASFSLMMSASYEATFMMIYIMVLYTWIKVEARHRGNQILDPTFVYGINNRRPQPAFEDRSFNYDDMRRAFQYMCFILVGFFGSGNIASLNSFDPMWTKCFVTVFSPFTMTALIVLKRVVPFIYATCAFRAIVISTRTNLQIIFSAILFISDAILIHFLYNIKNVGSWAEIGTSISYFVFMEAFIVIILVLYGLAHLLTTMHYERPVKFRRVRYTR